MAATEKSAGFNNINILQQLFLRKAKVFCEAFMCFLFGFVIFWQKKNIYIKATHKKLVNWLQIWFQITISFIVIFALQFFFTLTSTN